MVPDRVRLRGLSRGDLHQAKRQYLLTCKKKILPFGFSQQFTEGKYFCLLAGLSTNVFAQRCIRTDELAVTSSTLPP